MRFARQGAPARVKRAPEAATETLSPSILGAGNRAVAALLSPQTRVVQRKVGWDKAVTQGYAWNVDERRAGKGKTIRRIPIEGFGEGLQQEQAMTPVSKDGGKTWAFKVKSTKIDVLSPESAIDRAIVLVPATLDAGKPIEVLVFLHGYTESADRPFAGWRTLPAVKPDGSGRKPGDADIEKLRQGIDTTDVAPVRDVALDDASGQLEESGFTQTVVVLPQGGLHSQFGKAGGGPGDYNFDSHTYVHKVVDQLQADHKWWDASGKVAAAAPKVIRISMAGHSGAGATLKNMAKESVKPGSARDSGILMGDLVLYDAMNSESQLSAFRDWALMHLDNALIVVKSPTLDDDTKLKYLRDAQKLRSYATGGDYKTRNDTLKSAIDNWFKTNKSKLGKFEAELRANFVVVNVNDKRKVGLLHEEMMRGAKAGQGRAGAGYILDALKGLHRP